MKSVIVNLLVAIAVLSPVKSKFQLISCPAGPNHTLITICNTEFPAIAYIVEDINDNVSVLTDESDEHTQVVFGGDNIGLLRYLSSSIVTETQDNMIVHHKSVDDINSFTKARIEGYKFMRNKSNNAFACEFADNDVSSSCKVIGSTTLTYYKSDVLIVMSRDRPHLYLFYNASNLDKFENLLNLMITEINNNLPHKAAIEQLDEAFQREVAVKVKQSAIHHLTNYAVKSNYENFIELDDIKYTFREIFSRRRDSIYKDFVKIVKKENIVKITRRCCLFADIMKVEEDAPYSSSISDANISEDLNCDGSFNYGIV